RVVVVLGGGENGFIGNKVDLGSTLFGSARLLQLAGRLAFGIRLLPGKSIAPDFQIQLFTQRVHAGNADAVQSAGNFVCGRIELAARMQLGHHDLRGGNFFAVNVHCVHGNAAAVVNDGDGIIQMNGGFNFVGVAGERLVHGIVHDFIHE